ncbi:winged helix-turn-helix domain-containing protein [Roseobacter sp. HKCCD9010]|uniref:winged helix-turn-helix domain-containing protein n=1 Tax=unclassified Roseobacter TaxID=196798 RepID=UPI001492541B|nr:MULTISPECIES: crosslink repair DNA glycosylase YcaQ family protein [unclassified Roseobacter]MBF9051821.1 winged helix-turn-helix domain-containing protein [Rhodobacterales bacterium HKCCD4356]NNV13814.1 winged helix-turn-helix domain-containing protein [Roseobacter sp. HKCCD7357]NNV17839.1 winged helix-turn-helix domain-containing protein [Roseobacter sp. HKCCD8768]NNV27446.1 winged helix-turn-helix domain-containing protein [Roseobacter sp. HKCCD8192]NNV31566.1 winged helix-turn-helix dom
MARPVIDNATARRLFLHRHGLGDAPSGPATGAGLAQVIGDLGFVQVDSVNTVARAHDMILWSRRQAYKPTSLRWLNDRKRATFEHWTHDASILPMALFPHWRLKFARDAARMKQRWTQWQGGGFHAEIDRVLTHISDHGPVGSGDLAEQRPEKSTGWWDWHPSKTALEYLWRAGELSVSRREGFRKIYDLTERVIPPEALNACFDEAETVDWACAAALDRLGFATSGELAAFWDLVRPAEAKAWVADAVETGRAIEVEIALAQGGTRSVVMWPETLETLTQLSPIPPRLRILSPFDPALRDRNRAERLFGFHYRIEIFVPEAKRRYGYYVFPVMEGDRMIGRIDMKCDRSRGGLDVTGFWPEPGVRMGKGRHVRLMTELERVTRLTGCPDLRLSPGWLRHS